MLGRLGLPVRAPLALDSEPHWQSALGAPLARGGAADSEFELECRRAGSPAPSLSLRLAVVGRDSGDLRLRLGSSRPGSTGTGTAALPVAIAT